MEKHRAIQSRIHSVIINQDKITDQDKINKQIFSFYQSLLSRQVQFQTDIIEAYLDNIPLPIEAYLDNIPLPKLINEQTLSCEGIISEDKVFKSLKSMDNNKSPENNRLSKEFYECCLDEVKKPFLASIHKAFLNQELSISQKQAVIKMLQKRTKIKDSLRTGGRYHCLILI